MTDMPLRAMTCMSAFAFAWVLVEEVIGSAISQPYPLLQIVWCRYAVHLALMLLVNLHVPSRMWRTRRLGFHLSRSILMLIMPASFAMSLKAGLPVGSVWAVFWISPLMVLALARVVLGEGVPRRTWWICGLGSFAAAAMTVDRATPLGPTLLLPLGMAASFAGYVVMTRRLEGELLPTNLFYTAVGVFIVLTPVVPWSWVMPSVHDIALLVGIGAVGLVALWALDRAIAHASVATSLPALYLHLPALVLVASTIEDDVTSPRQALGGLLICSAVAWLAWTAWREAQPGSGRAVA